MLKTKKTPNFPNPQKHYMDNHWTWKSMNSKAAAAFCCCWWCGGKKKGVKIVTQV
jgi:hypothetical protein